MATIDLIVLGILKRESLSAYDIQKLLSDIVLDTGQAYFLAFLRQPVQVDDHGIEVQINVDIHVCNFHLTLLFPRLYVVDLFHLLLQVQAYSVLDHAYHALARRFSSRYVFNCLTLFSILVRHTFWLSSTICKEEPKPSSCAPLCRQ